MDKILLLFAVLTCSLIIIFASIHYVKSYETYLNSSFEVSTETLSPEDMQKLFEFKKSN